MTMFITISHLKLSDNNTHTCNNQINHDTLNTNRPTYRSDSQHNLSDCKKEDNCALGNNY